MQRPLAVLFVLLAGVASTARASVTVVHPVTTDTVQAAIDAAADGDILVLKPNAGAVFPGDTNTIDGKSLSLVADGGEVRLQHLIVRNLSADQQVLLQGLRLAPFNEFGFPYDGTLSGVVEVRACAGPVWLESCAVVAPRAAGPGRALTAQAAPRAGSAHDGGRPSHCGPAPCLAHRGAGERPRLAALGNSE
jgi:hypothetical protein